MSGYFHRILVKTDPVGVANRIKQATGYACDIIGPDKYGYWAIDFLGPRDVDLDFLRPDILPPRGKNSSL